MLSRGVLKGILRMGAVPPATDKSAWPGRSICASLARFLLSQAFKAVPLVQTIQRERDC
jgi:hypothetical protein